MSRAAGDRQGFGASTPTPSAVWERRDDVGVTNQLVMLPADWSAAQWPVATGWDFYSFPRPSEGPAK